MRRNDHSCWPLLGRDDLSALGAGTAGVPDHSNSSNQGDPLGFVVRGGVVVCSPGEQKKLLDITEKPANGFEPMTFALQKRCSTTELSRHCSILPISGSRVLESERLLHHPKG